MTENPEESGSPARTEANRELVRRYFDAMERGALDEAAGLWATDATSYASGRAGQLQLGAITPPGL